MSAIQSNPLPPSYSDPSADDILQESSSQPFDLPSYSAGRRVAPTTPTHQAVPKEFDYELKHEGKALAVLTIIAEEAFSKHLPTFLERPIKGRVKLIFDKPYKVQAVVISAYGQIVTGPSATEKFTFVDVSSTLWSTTMGNPRLLSADDSTTGSGPGTSTAKFTNKLKGEYIWNFSLSLPKEVVVPSGPRDEPQVFSLPQTFYERHTRVRVAYEVAVRVYTVVPTWIRFDNRSFMVVAPIGYMPIQRPGPFSTLRRLAYEEGIPLLGPTIDPTGWHTPRQFRIQGKVFDNHSVDMGCTLFLAKPLCYTRGSVIPLVLLLESQDHDALDLLSSPKSIVVRLRRCVKYYSGSKDTLELHAWRDAVEYSYPARWWPSAESFPSKRYLNGELHLGSDTKPTSAMAHFRMEYTVVLFSFDIIGYESTSDEPLFEQPVEIATAFGVGPRPMSFAPPEYESH